MTGTSSRPKPDKNGFCPEPYRDLLICKATGIAHTSGVLFHRRAGCRACSGAPQHLAQRRIGKQFRPHRLRAPNSGIVTATLRILLAFPQNHPLGCAALGARRYFRAAFSTVLPRARLLGPTGARSSGLVRRPPGERANGVVPGPAGDRCEQSKRNENNRRPGRRKNCRKSCREKPGGDGRQFEVVNKVYSKQGGS